MAERIQTTIEIRSGESSNFNNGQNLKLGEPAWEKDTKKLYIGNGDNLPATEIVSAGNSSFLEIDGDSSDTTVTVDNIGDSPLPPPLDDGDDQISNDPVYFAESTNPPSTINNGEQLSSIFGKIKKWFSSFGTGAWANIGTGSEDIASAQHAANHAASGTDAITPESINAADAIHAHSGADITSGQVGTAYGGTGISAISQADLLTKLGTINLGSGKTVLSANSDLNLVTGIDTYVILSNPDALSMINTPTGWQSAGILIVEAPLNDTVLKQTISAYDGTKFASRTRSGGTWGAWSQYYPGNATAAIQWNINEKTVSEWATLPEQTILYNTANVLTGQPSANGVLKHTPYSTTGFVQSFFSLADGKLWTRGGDSNVISQWTDSGGSGGKPKITWTGELTLGQTISIAGIESYTHFILFPLVGGGIPIYIADAGAQGKGSTITTNSTPSGWTEEDVYINTVGIYKTSGDTNILLTTNQSTTLAISQNQMQAQEGDGIMSIVAVW